MFGRFWPTVIARRRLPGHAPRNEAIAALLLDMDRQSEQLTTRYQGVDLLAMSNPDIAWLRKGVDETVGAYLTRVGIAYPVRWHLQAWPNVNRAGDYHAPHNHAWCYLSGTYYVQVPEADVEADSSGEQVPRAKATRGQSPGAISFYNPRPGAGLARRTRTRAAQETAFTLLPEPGTVLLWHASLNHLVHPNLADEPRISISFNVVLEWANHYVGTDSGKE